MQSGTMESYSKRKSCAKFFRQIYREEGLYRVSEALPIGSFSMHLYSSFPPSSLPSNRPSPLQGVGPTAQRAAVIAGVLLPSYDFFKKLILDSGLLRDGISTHFW